jgi:simple sugar transport system substrate-binding protein
MTTRRALTPRRSFVKLSKARLAVVPVVLLSLAMAACGGNGTSPGASAEKTVKVGVVLKTFNDYFSAMKAGIDKMPKDGIDLLGIEAPGDGSDAQAQINAIQNMVTRGADALAVAPVGPQVQPVLEQAIKQGVKVVLIDNDLPNLAGKSSYVGTDNRKGGQVAGTYLKEQLQGKGTLAVMSGIPGVPALDDRVNGVLEQLKGTQINVVTTLATQCDQTKGLNVMQAIGSSHPDVDAIYAACGPPVLGAIQARKKQDPFSKNLLLVGFDALPDEAKAIVAGDETASVAQFPQKMGTTAVLTAADAARGKQVSARIDTGTQIVTKDNAQQFTTFQ